MKLHLPKVLLTAVLAAVSMAPAAWAEWGEDSLAGKYWVNDTSNIDATGEAAGDPDTFTVLSGSINEAEIAEFIMRNGQSMTMSANSDASGGENLTLTIDSLKINPAEGAEGNGSATITVNANQSLTVEAINGSLTTVTAKGSFTYGGGGTIATVNLGQASTDTSSIVNITAATTMTSVNAWGGMLYVDSGNDALVTIGTYDGGKSGSARGGTYVKAGSRLQINTMYYHINNTSNAVTLEAGAVLTLGTGGLTVTGISSEAGSLATVDRHSGGGVYSYTAGEYTISNGQVKLNDGTLGNVLTNVSILHDGSGTLTLTNTSSTLKDITASAGTVNIYAGLKLGGRIGTSGDGEVVIKGAVVNTGMSFAENSALTVKDWAGFAGSGEYYGGAVSGNGIFNGNYTVLADSSTAKAGVKISYDGNVYTTDDNGAVAIHDTSLFFINAETENVSQATGLGSTCIRMSDNTGLVIDGSIDSVSAASGANLSWTLNTTDATTPTISTINAGGASITVTKDAASQSSTLSLGNAAHAVGSLTIGDGVTVTSSHDGMQETPSYGYGFVDGEVTVQGGGTLELTSQDALGYYRSANTGSPFTDRVTLSGSSSEKLATLKLGSHVVIERTDIHLNGNTRITYTDGAGGAASEDNTKGALESYGGSIVVTGTNNVSNAGLHARGGLTLNIGENATFEQAGNVYHGSNSGTVTKTGGGEMTFSGEATRMYKYVSSAGTTNFNKDTIIDNDLTAQGGIVNLGAATHTIHCLDTSKNAAAQGKIVLKENAKVTVTSSIWGVSTASINLEKDATLTLGAATIKGLSSEANQLATLKAIEPETRPQNFGGYQYSIGSSNFTLTNGQFTLTSNVGSGFTELNNKLRNVALVNEATGVLIVREQDADRDIASIHAKNGNVNLTNMQGDETLVSLDIADAMAVGAHTGYTGIGAGTDFSTISVTESVTLGSGAVVDGNLQLGSVEVMLTTVTTDSSATDALADIKGKLLLTLADTPSLTLDTDTMQAIAALGQGETLYILKAGEVDWGTSDAAMLADDTAVITPAEIDAALYIAGLNNGYNLNYDTTSRLMGITMTIPEPTTATLSLLALAGLAARRRRR